MTTESPRIGVLLCAHLPEQYHAITGGDYDVVYTRLLQEADPGIEVRTYDAIGGELPAAVDECDGWILTGSPDDAFAETPWILALREFILRAVAEQARVAGVCFGHQVVAAALGGEVARADAGFAVGPHEMDVEPTPWFRGGTVAINAMHRDVVTALPAGARRIATGTTAEFPAYVVGDNVLCVQDHPEFGAELTAALIRDRLDRMAPEVAEAGLERLESMPTHGAVVGRWLVDFLLDRRR